MICPDPTCPSHTDDFDACEKCCTLDCCVPVPDGTFDALQDTANSTVDDRERRLDLRCSHCPPNRKENAGRKPKHGTKKEKKR